MKQCDVANSVAVCYPVLAICYISSANDPIQSGSPPPTIWTMRPLDIAWRWFMDWLMLYKARDPGPTIPGRGDVTCPRLWGFSNLSTSSNHGVQVTCWPSEVHQTVIDTPRTRAVTKYCSMYLSLKSLAGACVWPRICPRNQILDARQDAQVTSDLIHW